MARRVRPAGRSGSHEAPLAYEATVSGRKLPRLLLAVALVLLTCHALLYLYHHRVEALHPLLLQLFDVDQENNLPTWFSAFLLLTASALCWLCGSRKRAERDPWAGHWSALALGFLLLSADEVAGVHETINSVIVMTWAIPALFVALVLGLAFAPFLLSLPRPTGLLFLLAAAMYVGGGAGLEVLGNEMVSQRLRETLQYRMATLVEEALEMLGVILFIYVLLRYMGGGRDGIRAAARVT